MLSNLQISELESANLFHEEADAYSEPCQTSKMERFAKCSMRYFTKLIYSLFFVNMQTIDVR